MHQSMNCLLNLLITLKNLESATLEGPALWPAVVSFGPRMAAILVATWHSAVNDTYVWYNVSYVEEETCHSLFTEICFQKLSGVQLWNNV